MLLAVLLDRLTELRPFTLLAFGLHVVDVGLGSKGQTGAVGSRPVVGLRPGLEWNRRDGELLGVDIFGIPFLGRWFHNRLCGYGEEPRQGMSLTERTRLLDHGICGFETNVGG